MKILIDDNDKNIDALIKVTGRPRSGNLAATGNYHLSKAVCDLLQKDKDKKEEKRKAIKMRKDVSDTIHIAKFQVAAKRFFTGSEKETLPL